MCCHTEASLWVQKKSVFIQWCYLGNNNKPLFALLSRVQFCMDAARLFSDMTANIVCSYGAGPCFCFPAWFSLKHTLDQRKMHIVWPLWHFSLCWSVLWQTATSISSQYWETLFIVYNAFRPFPAFFSLLNWSFHFSLEVWQNLELCTLTVMHCCGFGSLYSSGYIILLFC